MGGRVKNFPQSYFFLFVRVNLCKGGSVCIKYEPFFLLLLCNIICLIALQH